MPVSTWDWDGDRRNHDRMRRPLPIAVGTKDMDSDPETNLLRFEREARECGAFGETLDFDAVVWVVADAKPTASREKISLWFTRLPRPGEADKSADKRTPLPPRFAVFAKSTIRLLESTRHYEPAMYDRLLRAFRLLYEALVARGSPPFPWELRSADFETAARMGQAMGYSEDTCRTLRIDLQKIARVCDVYRLTWDGVDYNPPIRSIDRTPATGAPDLSIPSPAVISALARINTEATDISDIAMMSAIRIIAPTHLRAGDALQLSVDCEVFMVDGREADTEEYDAASPEVRRYGLRYFDGKEKNWDLKPVIADAVPIVRDAILAARLMSAPSRRVARRYASGAGRLPPSLGTDDILSVSDVAEAFGKSGNSMNDWIEGNRVPVLDEAVSRSDLEAGLAATTAGWPRTRALHAAAKEFLDAHANATFTCGELGAALPLTDVRRWLRKLGAPVRPRSLARAEIERALVALQPSDRGLPVPLADHLFLFPGNLFAAGHQVFMPVATPMTVDQLRLWLRGSREVKSVFKRFACREANGDPIVVTAHAFRRWLITAGGTGMSAAQLREWTNHAGYDSLARYIRETEAEIGDKIMEGYRRTGMAELPEPWR